MLPHAILTVEQAPEWTGRHKLSAAHPALPACYSGAALALTMTIPVFSKNKLPGMWQGLYETQSVADGWALVYGCKAVAKTEGGNGRSTARS